jgi:hypothetical protein
MRTKIRPRLSLSGGFMAAFVDFLQRLLTEGTVVLRAKPEVEARERRRGERLLAAAFEEHRLDVAGPPIDFDAVAAVAAAEKLWFALWFLLQRSDPPDEIEKRLTSEPAPLSAAQHLSADVALRFLPQVHRRAQRADAADILTKCLEELLRSYPLSGVLADIEEGPATPAELDHHPGLLLLYAERLADHPRPAWVPQGPAFAYVEIIFAERGLPTP